MVTIEPISLAPSVENNGVIHTLPCMIMRNVKVAEGVSFVVLLCSMSVCVSTWAAPTCWLMGDPQQYCLQTAKGQGWAPGRNWAHKKALGQWSGPLQYVASLQINAARQLCAWLPFSYQKIHVWQSNMHFYMTKATAGWPSTPLL